MNQLNKLVNHLTQKIKFVFLDFDKTITVHEGFYDRSDFIKIYLKPLKWKLPLNPLCKNLKHRFTIWRFNT